MNRRKYLAGVGSAFSLAVVGCVGDEEDPERETSDTMGEENPNRYGYEYADEDEPLIDLLSHEFYNEGPDDTGVTGQVENVSGEELWRVFVEVYFLDEDEIQIGEEKTNARELADGRVWEFDAVYSDYDPERIDSYQIFTDVIVDVPPD